MTRLLTITSLTVLSWVILSLAVMGAVHAWGC